MLILSRLSLKLQKKNPIKPSRKKGSGNMFGTSLYSVIALGGGVKKVEVLGSARRKVEDPANPQAVVVKLSLLLGEFCFA